MRSLIFFCCLSAQALSAQPGFNKGVDYGYFFNFFNDVVVQNDTIVAYGLAQDTAWPYQQGVLVARFDTLGAILDNVLILDTINNIYSIDKGWGKIIPTSEGGFAMTTATLYGRDGVFIKLNQNLELEFVQRYRDTINLGEFLVSPIEVPDGFLLFGYYQREGNAKHDAVLRKVDKQGNLIWRKNYGVSDRYEEFYKAAPWGDSLLVFSGWKSLDLTDYTNIQPWLTVFNKQGELQWEWTGGTPTTFNGLLPAWFYPQKDSTWLAYGSKYLGIDPEYNWQVYQAYWIKLDRNFQFEWGKPFGPHVGYQDRFIKVLQAANGDIIGVGERGPFDIDPETYYRKGWIMRFSPEADSLWEWTGKMPIANPGAHFLSGGALLSSGSIVASGKGEDPDGLGYCWLVKLSPDGCVDTLFCHATSSVHMPEVEKLALKLFPNPAQDHVEIRISGESLPIGARILLRDLQGKVLKEHKVTSLVQSLSLAEFPPGMYFVNLVSGAGIILACQKIVVSP